MAGKRPSTSSIYAYAESLRKEMLAEFAVVQEQQFARAEHETNGYMVNERGRQKGLSGWDVFHGPPSVFEAYATDELREHGRPLTRTAFEQAWLESRVG